MKTLILHNIISSNSVYKLNSYILSHKKEVGEVLVVFCSTSESNRKWKLNEKMKFRHKNLKSRGIKLKGQDLFTYFFSPRVFSHLNKFDPDRIIICGWDQFAYQAAFVWGGIKGKHVTLWSGSTVNEKSWRRIVTLPLVKFFVSLCDDYIAYGSMAKRYLISLGASSKKIEIFRNDVNGKYFSKEASRWRKRRKLQKSKLNIKTKYNFIYVGQFIKRKGIMNLVYSFGKFKENNKDWGLVMCGYGQMGKRIKEYVEEHNIPDVYFLGTIEQYRLPQIYVVCDCLILPSKEEVWGLVVNEALYCGLKVIVSNKCGCAPDLVKPNVNGYVFDTEKKFDLIRHMEKAVTLIKK